MSNNKYINEDTYQTLQEVSIETQSDYEKAREPLWKDDIDQFKKHLDEYHLNGSSVHEENGHYFTVDQKFRDKINSLYEQE